MTGGGGHPPRQSHSPDPRPLSVAQAAAYLGLPPDAVRALVDAGFLQPVDDQPGGPRLALAELRAFMVWNVDQGGDDVIDVDVEAAGPEALRHALDGRSEEMAQRVFDTFSRVFPEAQAWSPSEQARFVDRAQRRLRLVLALTGPGTDVDEAVAGELESVGAAGWDAAPLPQMLVVLRISRDLMVQAAVEMAADRGRHWALALSVFLTRVLPAVDSLTDSLAQEYWSAVVGRHKEARARFEHIVEHSPDGAYEIDFEGRIRYANPQLGLMLGRRRLQELEGALLTDVMESVSGPATGVLLHPSGGPEHLELTVSRPDGVRRVLHVRSFARLREGEPVGFQGVVRDVTADHELQAQKDRLLASLLGELRLALVRVADLGAGLESEGGRLPGERLRSVGTSLVGHVQAVSAVVEEVDRVSRMEVEAPVMAPHPVELGYVVSAALAGSEARGTDVDVHVPAGLRVMADAEGLVSALRELVDEAVRHGRAPVRVEVEGVVSGELQLAVTSHGRASPRGGEEGVARARALVEAMGGRVWYVADAEGAGCFRLTVPVPNRRRGDDVIRL